MSRPDAFILQFDALNHDFDWSLTPMPLVRHCIQPALKFKIKYPDDWKEALAKSMEEAMYTLGLTDNERDPTRVTMTSSQSQHFHSGSRSRRVRFRPASPPGGTRS